MGRSLFGMPAAILALCVSCAACATSEPPPAETTADKKADAPLNDLLTRADAVTPKDAPDAKPMPPPDTTSPIVVVQEAPRRPTSGYYPQARPYGSPYASPYAYNDPQYPQRPEKTPMEKMAEQAERAFGYRIANAASQQRQLDSLRYQQRAVCGGSRNASATGNSVYNPNAMPSSTSASAGTNYVTDNSASPECRSATANLAYQEPMVRRTLDSIDIDAKKMGIYPGVIRDLFSRYGVNH